LIESLLCMVLIADQMEKSLFFKILIWEDIKQKLLCLILAHPIELLVGFYHLFGKSPIEQRKGKLPNHVFTTIEIVPLIDFMKLKPTK